MTSQKTDLLIATGNLGKIRELKEMFADVPVRLRSLDEFAGISEVPEIGSTFRENALLKARGYAVQTGVLTLADDSGLEVAALGGAPGVYSARFAGEDTPYPEKIAALLRAIGESTSNDRSARFVCCMVIADADGREVAGSEGVCEGRIAEAPFGTGGFGYDPVFVPDGHERTFGELPAAVKRALSHRARAASRIIPYLLDFTAV